LDDSEFRMQFQDWDIRSYKYKVWKFLNFMYKDFDMWLQFRYVENFKYTIWKFLDSMYNRFSKWLGSYMYKVTYV
jgi:hypothetical protein